MPGVEIIMKISTEISASCREMGHLVSICSKCGPLQKSLNGILVFKNSRKIIQGLTNGKGIITKKKKKKKNRNRVSSCTVPSTGS